MALTDAIKDAIKKNLPEQVAEELRSYIEEAKAQAENLKHISTQLKEAHYFEKQLTEEIEQLKNKLKSYQNLEQREKDVLAKEKQIALTELSEVKEKEKVVLMQGLVNAIFRNKTIMHRNSSFGNDAQYPGGSYNKTNNTTIEEV